MQLETRGSGAAPVSATIADMVPRVAAEHPDRIAMRHKDGERWVDVSYRELAETIREIALGLVDLGLERGDRVAILARTRPEWTCANFGILGAGGAAASVYATNSAEECAYVLGHAEARGVFVEDAEQLAKIESVRGELPDLEWVVVMAPDGPLGEAMSLDELRSRGRTREPREYEERVGGTDAADPCMFIYTSGTTGPPKGCVLTHRNLRAQVTMCQRHGLLAPEDDIFLFLPLAHAFALVVQFLAVDLAVPIAYWGRDPKRVVDEIQEVRPSAFPSVPRVFEKAHTVISAQMDGPGLRPRLLRRAVAIGRQVHALERRGEKPGRVLAARHALLDRIVLSKVRNRFGGRLTRAITGAAPLSPEIIEFFFACGVPVLEGYGLTEASPALACNQMDNYRIGSVGRYFQGVEMKVTEEGELLARGENVFAGYHRDPEATAAVLKDGWLYTGDLGHIDEDGFVYITDRKKDLIITAGGKNITPANIEHKLKLNRWIAEAVVIGDRRPFLVALLTLDPDEAPAFAAEHGLDVSRLNESEEMRREVEQAVAEVNAAVGRESQIKKFAILGEEMTVQSGELTPSLKVKRAVVTQKYADELERLYAR